MTPLLCKYYESTGFREDEGWKDGTLLQFVSLSHGGVVGVVFCHRGGGLRHLKLDDIRVERAVPASDGLVSAPVSATTERSDG